MQEKSSASHHTIFFVFLRRISIISVSLFLFFSSQFLRERSGEVLVVKWPQVVEVNYCKENDGSNSGSSATSSAGGGGGSGGSGSDGSGGDLGAWRFRCLQVKDALSDLCVVVGEEMRALHHLLLSGPSGNDDDDGGLLKLATFDQ